MTTPHSYTTFSRGLPDGKYVKLACPKGIKAYNQQIGGVDLTNQMPAILHMHTQSSNRWYFHLFWFLLDLAIDNVFILECRILK